MQTSPKKHKSDLRNCTLRNISALRQILIQADELDAFANTGIGPTDLANLHFYLSYTNDKLKAANTEKTNPQNCV